MDGETGEKEESDDLLLSSQPLTTTTYDVDNDCSSFF